MPDETGETEVQDVDLDQALTLAAQEQQEAPDADLSTPTEGEAEPEAEGEEPEAEAETEEPAGGPPEAVPYGRFKEVNDEKTALERDNAAFRMALTHPEVAAAMGKIGKVEPEETGDPLEAFIDRIAPKIELPDDFEPVSENEEILVELVQQQNEASRNMARLIAQTSSHQQAQSVEAADRQFQAILTAETEAAGIDRALVTEDMEIEILDAAAILRSKQNLTPEAAMKKAFKIMAADIGGNGKPKETSPHVKAAEKAKEALLSPGSGKPPAGTKAAYEAPSLDEAMEHTKKLLNLA